VSSTTIRHSGVLENTHSPAIRSSNHPPPSTWESASRPASRYPYGYDPADEPHPEPAHLRHRPGDNWEIGGRPYDPDDPGLYGSPGWRPDRRTGRHRRGELPDPLLEPNEHRLAPLREAAFEAFLSASEQLHQAHFEADRPNRATARLTWLYQLLIALLHLGLVPFPERGERDRDKPTETGTAERARHRPSPGPRRVTFERRALGGAFSGGGRA
jgi:hypothetical protein